LNRRGFLAGVAAFFGLPGLAPLLDPALRGAKARWIDVGPLEALPEGLPKRFTFPVRAGWERREKSGFLVRRGEQVIAFDATCTHAGCAVRSEGAPGAGFVCPCHGGAFSLDGEPVKKPVKAPLARFETRVEGGSVKVRV
jgi:nitrite reductase/ring-hydroxylating ferredoxin subunit